MPSAQAVRLCPHAVFLPGLLHPSRIIGNEFSLLLPHSDVGNKVLDRLESANRLPEGLTLLRVFNRIFENSINDARTQSCHHDALVIEGRQHLVPAFVDLPHHIFVVHEHLVEENLT